MFPVSKLPTIRYLAPALLLMLPIAQIPFIGFWLIVILASVGMGACMRKIYRQLQVSPAPLIK